MNDDAGRAGEVPRFDRRFQESEHRITRLGKGGIGGKATGLVRARDLLAEDWEAARHPAFRVEVPRLVVVPADVHEAFLERNDLWGLLESPPDDDRLLAHEFQRADLPTEVAGDLRALAGAAHTPLAVRSSSLLEDALERPFAGVYATKMTPNDQPDPDLRFRRLVESIKFVWASTWFRSAREYRRAAGVPDTDERMAVVIQEVVGRRHGERFYPHLSGVARSHDFYPKPGARPEDGVVNLALGLGKTIVDGGVCWTYSPARPKAPPPFASTGDLIKNSQLRFWAVRMGKPPVFDPLAETEYLVENGLDAAEADRTLARVASTYDPGRDRLSPGTGFPGPRVLDFGPLLRLGEPPLNDLLRELLAVCERRLGADVEIEFAITFPGPGEPPETRLGFLQVRPMLVSDEAVAVEPEEFGAEDVLVASGRVMGNGTMGGVLDVVYVRPDRFLAKDTPAIAAELQALNRELVEAGRPYLLIGFGRWGSSDPWLGIPVEWAGIAGARVIVEATAPGMDVEPSQGAHFFHNISSFRVSYFSVHHDDVPGIAWSRLEAAAAERETEHLRHLRLREPLDVRVDGRTGRGVVRGGGL